MLNNCETTKAKSWRFVPLPNQSFPILDKPELSLSSSSFSLSTSPILQKRLESLTEAELAQLIEQVEEEKRRLASEEQPK